MVAAGAAAAAAAADPPLAPAYEWCETAPPHARPPASVRARGLAASGGKGASLLATATTADLHPASWFAVAWYPLYAVPPPRATARARDLRAAFLTYHSFAPPEGAAVAPWGRAPLLPPAPPPPTHQPVPPPLGSAADSVLTGRAAAAAAAAAATAAGCGVPPPPAAAALPAWGLVRYRVAGPAWDDAPLEATYAAMEAAAGEWTARRGAVHADAAFFAHGAPTWGR